MRMMPRAAPSAMRRWGVQRRWLILHDSGAQRTVQNNVNVKSGWLMKDLQYVLSSVELFLALFLLYGGMPAN